MDMDGHVMDMRFCPTRRRLKVSGRRPKRNWIPGTKAGTITSEISHRNAQDIPTPHTDNTTIDHNKSQQQRGFAPHFYKTVQHLSQISRGGQVMACACTELPNAQRPLACCVSESSIHFMKSVRNVFLQ